MKITTVYLIENIITLAASVCIVIFAPDLWKLFAFPLMYNLNTGKFSQP